MHFDLADLRLFIHIAESPSLTQAAKRAHLSLAAVSVRIKALENQLNTRLLYRDSRGVEITPAGQKLLQHARVIMRQVDHLKHDFQEQADGDAGHIRIFANTTAVTEFMPDILAQFLSGHPGVTVDLQERLTRDIVRGVLDGTTDLGIVAGPVDAPELQAIHFSTDRLVLATPRGHRFARRRRIAFAETLDDDAIGMQQGSTLQTFLAGVTERLGKPMKLRIQLSSFDAMCRMIGAGVGIGIVPESAARRNRDGMGLALIELTDAWSVRERRILVRDQGRLPRHAQALIEVLQAYYATPAAS
jgi:DNA-binding transcriptional LysR family regulator